MASSIAVIQGASRGLGYEFAKQLMARNGVKVIATARQPEKSKLSELKNDVDIYKMNINSEEEIAQFSEYVKKEYGRVDFLLNSSGMLHPSGRGETRIQDVTLQGIQETFLVNTFGPLMMAKHFLSLLQKGNASFGTQSSDGKPGHAAVMASLSARVGSIGDNGLGGWYSYRMSKAALNMANKNFSVEFGRSKNKILCLALHPGTVDTDISRPYHKNVPQGQLLTVEYSVQQLLSVIDNASMKDSGRYLAYDGKDISF